MRIRSLILIILLSSFTPLSQAGEMLAGKAIAHRLDHGQESLLVGAMQNISKGDTRAALPLLEQLVESNPKFRLAQLMYADLLLSQSRPIWDFGNLPSAPYQQIAAFREEARVRWQHHVSPPSAARLPASLVQLSDSQKHVLVVDMNASRLYLFENRDGIPVLLKDFYTTIGKQGSGKYVEGDQKTPVGVYFVTSFIEPEELPDLYGDGAFPIDYPNVWDRRNGRTGYGIWLHGTPSATFSRPPRDSNGCVIVSNRDLNTLFPFIQTGFTPVILADSIDWITRGEWQKRQSEFAGKIERWRRDWESRDADRYLSHYSREYSGLGKDYNSWVAYKRRVNPSKEFIKVQLKEKSMFLYPGEEALLVVTFEQNYLSNNVKRRFTKRQYWKKDRDGKWRIIYEGSVS